MALAAPGTDFPFLPTRSRLLADKTIPFSIGNNMRLYCFPAICAVFKTGAAATHPDPRTLADAKPGADGWKSASGNPHPGKLGDVYYGLLSEG
jgi:hypothetical protein